jgi:hypothetical protein
LSGTAADVLVQLADASNVARGDAQVAVKKTFTGAVETTAHEVNDREVHVFDFLSVAQKADVLAQTLAVDCYTAVMAAIVCAQTLQKRLVWPSGKMLLAKALNCTNFGSTGLTWVGAGFSYDMNGGTVLAVRSAADGTLSPGWVADFTGTQNVHIENMNFWGNGANAATKGLLFARSATYTYAQQVKLSRVCVRLGTAPAATSLGSIAIANIQAEQWIDEHCSFEADVAFVGMLNNDISLVSPFVAAGFYLSLYSATVLCSTQSTFGALLNSAVYLYGVGSSQWRSAVFARQAGSTFAAISLNSSAVAYQYPQSLLIEGQVEGFPTGVAFNSAGMDCYGVHTRLFMAAPAASTPFISTANNVVLRQCRFDNQQTSNLAAGYFAVAFGTGVSLYGGEIVLYPSQSLSALSNATNYGCRINYHGNGTGLQNLTAGTNITLLGAPNAPSSWIDSEGFVHLAGLLQATAVVAAGATVATLATAHRPNRTVNGACFMSGIGVAYFTLTSAGVLSVGAATVNGTQIDLSAISFKAAN